MRTSPLLLLASLVQLAIALPRGMPSSMLTTVPSSYTQASEILNAAVAGELTDTELQQALSDYARNDPEFFKSLKLNETESAHSTTDSANAIASDNTESASALGAEVKILVLQRGSGSGSWQGAPPLPPYIPNLPGMVPPVSTGAQANPPLTVDIPIGPNGYPTEPPAAPPSYTTSDSFSFFGLGPYPPSDLTTLDNARGYADGGFPYRHKYPHRRDHTGRRCRYHAVPHSDGKSLGSSNLGSSAGLLASDSATVLLSMLRTAGLSRLYDSH